VASSSRVSVSAVGCSAADTDKSSCSPVKINSFFAGIDAGPAHVENSYTSQNGLIVTNSPRKSTADEEAVKNGVGKLYTLLRVDLGEDDRISLPSNPTIYHIMVLTQRLGRWVWRKSDPCSVVDRCVGKLYTSRSDWPPLAAKRQSKQNLMTFGMRVARHEQELSA
jgi:hypothetical protein